MRKKQKKVMMIGLGVLAAALCALKLGPILTGAPLVAPQKKKSTSGKKTTKGKSKAKTKRGSRSSGRARRPTTQRRTTRTTPGRKTAGPHNEAEECPLESIPIDLSATERRALVYRAVRLRNPFSAAKFEVTRESDALVKMKVNLQGIVRTAGRRLAIIEGQVYAEGEKVAKGVTLVKIDATSVLLTDGKNETRLYLSDHSPRIGTH